MPRHARCRDWRCVAVALGGMADVRPQHLSSARPADLILPLSVPPSLTLPLFLLSLLFFSRTSLAGARVSPQRCPTTCPGPSTGTTSRPHINFTRTSDRKTGCMEKISTPKSTWTKSARQHWRTSKRSRGRRQFRCRTCRQLTWWTWIATRTSSQTISAESAIWRCACLPFCVPAFVIERVLSSARSLTQLWAFPPLIPHPTPSFDDTTSLLPINALLIHHGAHPPLCSDRWSVPTSSSIPKSSRSTTSPRQLDWRVEACSPPRRLPPVSNVAASGGVLNEVAVAPLHRRGPGVEKSGKEQTAGMPTPVEPGFSF